MSPAARSPSPTVDAPSVPLSGTERNESPMSPEQYRNDTSCDFAGAGSGTLSKSADSQPDPETEAATTTPMSASSDVEQSLEQPMSSEASRTVHPETTADASRHSDEDITSSPHPSSRPASYGSASPDEDVRLGRALENHENGFVRTLAVYQCQKTLAESSDMRSFRAAAFTCTELRAGIDVESPEWYLIWTGRVASIRRSEMPFVPGVTTPENHDYGISSGNDDNSGEDEDSQEEDSEDEESGDEESEGGDGEDGEMEEDNSEEDDDNDDDDNDDDDNQRPCAGRIMPSHWRFSASE